MDKIIYGLHTGMLGYELIGGWQETPVRIAYLGNGDWEIQVGDDEPLVLEELEEAIRQLKEENPE